VKAEDQLGALSHLDELFGQHGIEYWLFGGWQGVPPRRDGAPHHHQAITDAGERA
jgi:hypothetical protein